MKCFLFSLSLIFISSFSFAGECQDFSGDYKLVSAGLDVPAALTIQQSGCEKFVLKYPSRDEVYVLDGVKVQHDEVASIGMVVFTTSYVRDGDIVIDIENVFKDREPFKIRRRFHFYRSVGVMADEYGYFNDSGEFEAKLQNVYEPKRVENIF